jgi:hypothetical protein
VAEQHVAAVVEQRVAVVAEQGAVVGAGNRSFAMFLVACKICKWREAICGERC